MARWDVKRVGSFPSSPSSSSLSASLFLHFPSFLDMLSFSALAVAEWGSSPLLSFLIPTRLLLYHLSSTTFCLVVASSSHFASCSREQSPSGTLNANFLSRTFRLSVRPSIYSNFLLNICA